MAYSPSPRPAALAAAGKSKTLPRLSPTPPPPPPNPAVSKRDKRKNALTDRLRDISANFANNRDIYYRQQLQSYQVAMNYINEARPYENKPLDDLADDVIKNISETVSGNTQGGQRNAQAGLQPRFQAPPRSGKWAAVFVHEVNAAMEERDAQLTFLADRHNHKIHELQEDRKFMTKVAREEHDRLVASVRHRLIHAVNINRNTLNREKDRFDIADTNTLRLYPHHLSITHPASPGGSQNNRKTRHTRHRIDIDDLSAIGDSNKRKRKAPADADNDSPGPNGRSLEGEIPQAWKDSQDVRETHQNAPLYTIDRLFTERELDMNLQAATLTTVNYFSNKRAKTNGDAVRVSNPEARINGDISDDEEEEEEKADIDDTDAAEAAEAADKVNSDNEDVFLTAPEMDRTANNSVHATRSTRTFTLNPSAPSALGEMAGRKAAIRHMGTQKEKKTKTGDDITRGGQPLTEAEATDDLAMIAAAIKDEEENAGRTNKQMLLDLVPERPDHVSAALTGRIDPGRVDLSMPHLSNIRPPIVAADHRAEEDDELYN